MVLNWTILKVNEDKYDVIDKRNFRVAIIERKGEGWLVDVLGNSKLYFEWSSLDVCVGYVRGVERMLEVNSRKGRAA